MSSECTPHVLTFFGGRKDPIPESSADRAPDLVRTAVNCPERGHNMASFLPQRPL